MQLSPFDCTKCILMKRFIILRHRNYLLIVVIIELLFSTYTVGN